MTELKANALRLRISVDLREIQALYADLRAEAVSHADDPDLPGGDAMVMLGPSADPEAWSYRQLSAALGRTAPHGIYENDADPQPPLLVLATWEDCIRQELQTPTDKRATIEGAAKFLASSIDWCLDTDADGDINFLAIDDMAADIAKVRRRLEAVLHAGEQVDRGAPCLSHGRRYVKVWDDEKDEPTEYGYRWRCHGDDEGNGKHWADPEDYARANRDQARGLADRLIASDMHLEYRIKPSTLRTWAERMCVPKRGKDQSGRQLYDVAAAKANRDGEHEHTDQCGETREERGLLQELLGA